MPRPCEHLEVPMLTALSQGVSYSYDERCEVLTVYRRGVRWQEQGRLDTRDQRNGRAVQLLRQLSVRNGP